jgi:pimeloyl-ACP methyl ester carboxylesterase
MNKVIRVVATATAAAIATALLQRRYEQSRLLKKTKLTRPRAVDERVFVACNGAEHAVLVRGKERRNPVLLFVHGGPGTPDGMTAGKFDDALVKHFVVVRYDQRGTGKSERGVKHSDLNAELFVQDVIAMAEYVKAKFPRQPLVLVGHSWGSFLGLLAASRRPELFDAYVGIGQIVNIRKSEPESYRYTMREATRRNKTSIVNKLKKLNPHNFYIDFNLLLRQRRILFNVGGVFRRKRTAYEMMAAAWFSPDYTLMDLWRSTMRVKQLGKQLYWQMSNYDFTTLMPRLDMPTFFISGTFDYQISPELAKKYLDTLDAPQKDFIWIDHAGHFANFEQPEAFCHALLGITERLGLKATAQQHVPAIS